MHVLAWILSGLLAGWLTGYSLGGRGYGIPGNLLVGLSGGIIGGWVFHHVLHLTPPGGSLLHVLVALVGGILLVVAVRLLDGATRRVRQLAGGPETGAAGDLEAQIGKLGELERRVLSLVLRRKPVASDPHADFEAQATFGQRLADRVAAFGGSWTFIMLFFAVIALWMLANAREQHPFDPYPFILLNLVLSCVAAMQAPVIMMSQNRQAVKDRLDAQNDYRVNLSAEVHIQGLHAKFDELREEKWAQLVELQRQQIALLTRILEGPRSEGAGGESPSPDRR